MATGAVVADLLMPDFRGYKFDFDDFIKEELKLDLNREFKRTGEGICKFYLQGNCRKGNNCQYQHTNQPNARYHERAVVCKHWLRGLCKKGDQCEFLHEFNMTKMPECWFYSRFGECSNGDECQYRHIDPDTKIKECPWYARGFCKHGPICRHKHVRKMLCLNYLTGFCPYGPACPNGHAKYELPPASALQDEPRRFDPLEQAGNDGGANSSFSGGSFERFGGNSGGGGGSGGGNGGVGHMRNLENVTCFKCGEKGHYANRCPQGRGGGL